MSRSASAISATPPISTFPFHLVDFAPSDTYGRALLVCVLNTLLVSAMAIVTATLLGLLVGIMRLSTNWLVRNLALGFIELVRNTPHAGPDHLLVRRRAADAAGAAAEHHSPRRLAAEHPRALPAVAGVQTGHGGVLGCIAGASCWSRRRWSGACRRVGGARPWCCRCSRSACWRCGFDHVDFPALRGFNIAGGVQVPPELVAVWAGLSIYSRRLHRRDRARRDPGGASRAAGGRAQPWPEAGPGAVPGRPAAGAAHDGAAADQPVSNLIKSSSLGAAVAYPELFQIFAGTVLNQSGRETRDD